MKKFLIFFFTIFLVTNLSHSVVKKTPGVKYSDSLKQARADKAAAAGRVVPKQSGIKYSDTLRQVENNQRAAEGKTMRKISGQSYSNTLAGVATSKKSNEELKKNREKLKKEAIKLRKEMESGGKAKVSELSDKLKKDILLWNRYITQLQDRIWTLERAEKQCPDNCNDEYIEYLDFYQTLNKDDIWSLVVQVDLNRMEHESRSYLTYFQDIEKLEGKDKDDFYKFLIWPTNMDYNVQMLPFEFYYKLQIKKHRENGESWDKAKEKAEKDVRNKTRDIIDEHCRTIKKIEYSNVEKVLRRMIYWEGSLESQALKAFKKIGFKNLHVLNTRCY